MSVSDVERTRLIAIVEEMHRHVVGALVVQHSVEPSTVPARIVGKWVTEFDAVLRIGPQYGTSGPVEDDVEDVEG